MFAYDRLQYANGGLCNAPNIFDAKRKQHSNHPNQSDRGPGNLGRSVYLIAIDSVIRPSAHRPLAPESFAGVNMPYPGPPPHVMRFRTTRTVPQGALAPIFLGK